MDRILIPAESSEDWKRLLAEPEKQWKKGYSARALANCWQEANGLPQGVQRVFSESGIEAIEKFELLLALPEHKVPLPGGSRPSQNDIWVLGRSNNELVSIAVEGKVSEPFGPTVAEWLQGASPGKKIRLDYLKEQLGLTGLNIDHIRYQLLHRTVSAIIEARRFNATHAVMLVHSFSRTDEWYEDYEQFVSLFGVSDSLNRITAAGKCGLVLLYFAWVHGDERYLKI